MPLIISRTIAVKQKLGRNEPCYCGSGKKYKKCHLSEDEGYVPEKKTGQISTFVDFLWEQSFFQDLVDKAIYDVFEGKLLEEEELKAVTEAVIFAGNYKNHTPFHYFITHAPLSSTEKKMYERWEQESRFSLFEILTVVIGKSMIVTDIMDGKTYHISERLGTYQAESGMIIGSRIVPTETPNYWMYTGGTMASFSKEAAYMIKRLVKTAKTHAINQLEFIKIYYGKQESPKSNWTNKNASSQHIGPKEEILIQTLIKEAHEKLINQQENFDTLPSKIRQKQIDEFSERWFETPQDELGRITPKEIIEEERRSRGITEKFKYSLQVTAMGQSNDPAVDLYDKGITLMREFRYLDALENFARVYKDLSHMPEPFRWWANTGSCLANLGEEDIAKKYYQKALAINPDYDVAKNNLATFNDSGKVQGLHRSGKQRLLETILKRPLQFDDKQVKQNELLHDTIVFLSYIKEYSPAVTAVKKDVKRKDFLSIAHQFIHPDPEEIIIKTPKREITDFYKEEWQFPKINFLHVLLLAGKLMKREKDRLKITKNGEAFLKLSPAKQFETILLIWFVTLSWAALDRRTGWVSVLSMDKKMSEILQAVSFQMLENLKMHFGELISISEMIKGIFQKQDDLLDETFSSILIQRLTLQYFAWAGFIENQAPVGPPRIQQPEPLFKQPVFRTTPFGEYVIATIKQAMYNAIPKNLRTIV